MLIFLWLCHHIANILDIFLLNLFSIHFNTKSKWTIIKMVLSWSLWYPTWGLQFYLDHSIIKIFKMESKITLASKLIWSSFNVKNTKCEQHHNSFIMDHCPFSIRRTALTTQSILSSTYNTIDPMIYHVINLNWFK